MTAGTIFVLCLVAAFGVFVVYMAVQSRRLERNRKETSSIPDQPAETSQRRKLS